MPVTIARTRELILSLQDATAAPHVDREAFRARGNIFASLRTDGVFNVKLSPDEQALRCGAAPDVYKPVDGGWGKMGFTTVNLEAAGELDVKSALLAAWTLSREKLFKPEAGTSKVTKPPTRR
jgi:hypothetical protein